MSVLNDWRQRASEVAARGRRTGVKAGQRLNSSAKSGLSRTTSIAAEAYNASISWKNDSELSRWLTGHFSNQVATIGSKAMDAEYLRTHIGGGWHRLYDGGHTIAGSWSAIGQALPDMSALNHLGVWANEYWKDLITTRGMPIILLDHADKVGQYLKHLDSVDVVQLIGGELTGVSIYSNWNDPAGLVASTAATDCSGIVYANIIAPIVSLVALVRVYFLVKESEQDELRALIAPALKGLTRSGASILLITVIPGGFLLHLSSGIVISLAHGYTWDKAEKNKEAILLALKQCIGNLSGSLGAREPLASGI